MIAKANPLRRFRQLLEETFPQPRRCFRLLPQKPIETVPIGLVIRTQSDVTRAATVNALYKSCLAATNPEVRVLVIDLRLVRKADSKLVGCLVSLRRLAESAGFRLRIRPSAAVRVWLGLFNVTKLFEGARDARNRNATPRPLPTRGRASA